MPKCLATVSVSSVARGRDWAVGAARAVGANIARRVELRGIAQGDGSGEGFRLESGLGGFLGSVEFIVLGVEGEEEDGGEAR